VRFLFERATGLEPATLTLARCGCPQTRRQFAVSLVMRPSSKSHLHHSWSTLVSLTGTKWGRKHESLRLSERGPDRNRDNPAYRSSSSHRQGGWICYSYKGPSRRLFRRTESFASERPTMRPLPRTTRGPPARPEVFRASTRDAQSKAVSRLPYASLEPLAQPDGSPPAGG
jgi:hypothetical protein